MNIEKEINKKLSKFLIYLLLLINLFLAISLTFYYINNKKNNLNLTSYSKNALFESYAFSENYIFEQLLDTTFIKIKNEGSSPLTFLDTIFVRYDNLYVFDDSGSMLFNSGDSFSITSLPINLESVPINKIVRFKMNESFYSFRKQLTKNNEMYYYLLELNNDFAATILDAYINNTSTSSYLLNKETGFLFSYGNSYAQNLNAVVDGFPYSKIDNSNDTPNIVYFHSSGQIFVASYLYVDSLDLYFICASPLFSIEDSDFMILLLTLLLLLILLLFSMQYVKKSIYKYSAPLIEMIDFLKDNTDNNNINTHKFLSKINGTFKDLKHLEYENTFLQSYDAVTNTFNFNSTALEYNNLVTKKEPFGSILVTVTNLQYIYKMYSIKVGDMVLLEIANKIRRLGENLSIGRTTTTDFFITTTSSHHETEDLSNTINDLFKSSIFILNFSLKVDCNISYMFFDDEFSTFSDTITNLKYSNRINHSPSKKPKHVDSTFIDTISRKTAITDLCRSASRANAFYLMYQPELSLKSNKIVGFESLLRIDDKILGKVSPHEVIPTLEEHGYIINLGYIILDTAISFAKDLIVSDCDFDFISVNISALQLEEENFLSNVFSILDSHNLPYHYLQLEITETLLISDMDSTIQTLNDFRKQGITIALDDFGTKYSSFSYLVDLPIDTLKIDRSFTLGILENDKKQVVAKSILSMCQNLNLKTVVEGIEDKEVVDYFKGNGCDILQGYYFSPPLLDVDAKKILLKHN